jgi:hypothetical protein
MPNQTTVSITQLHYPSVGETPKYYFSLQVSQYQRTLNSNLMSVQFDTVGAITLPLPQNLVDTHQVEYSQVGIGPTIGTAMNSVDDIKNGKFGNIGPAFGNLLGAYLSGPLTGAGGSVYSAFNGVAPNEFLTVLLKGPTYKTPSFTWRFSPRTSAESVNLQNIIMYLNNIMSPEYRGAQWGFPYLVQPMIVSPSSSGGAKTYRFKPAFIAGLQDNLTPNGFPAFFDSEYPESIELTLNLIDVEFFIRGDFGSL